MKKKIYFLDDDSDDLHFLNEIAESLGHISTTFSMPPEFLKHLQNSPDVPDIFFIDIRMPYFDGYEMVRHLKSNERFYDIPIIIYSSFRDEAIIDRCFESGANCYIHKSAELHKIYNAVKYAINKDWGSFTPNSGNFLFRDY